MEKYHKLVRDKIPDIIRRNGGDPKTHVASQDEYRQKLFEKLKEEVEEFLKDQNETELADILEIVYALGKVIGVTPEELQTFRQKRVDERGAFRDGIILEEVDEGPRA